MPRPSRSPLFEEVPAPTGFPSLELLRGYLSAKYDTLEKEIHIGERSFSLLKVRDTNVLVDAIRPEEFSEDERLPYWAEIWTSSIELARWCTEDADLRGKRVLELGCGLGLAGIAAARAGALVTFSDYEPDALDFVRYNVQRNLPQETIETNISVLQFDWRRPPDLPCFDIVVAADVAYEQRMFASLIHLLSILVAGRGFAVITEPGRSVGQLFFSLLREHSFRVSTETTPVRYDGKTSSVVRATIQRADAG